MEFRAIHSATAQGRFACIANCKTASTALRRDKMACDNKGKSTALELGEHFLALRMSRKFGFRLGNLNFRADCLGFRRTSLLQHA